MNALAITPMFFGLLAPLLGALAPLIGQALIGIGVSLGLGYLSRKLQPQADTASRGMSLTLQMDSNDDRQVAFGRCASAGSLKYHNVYGPNGNDYLQLVYILADHECDALEGVIVNGSVKTIGADASTALATGNGVEDFDGRMWIEFHSGAFGQAADADLVDHAPSGGWDADDRAAGCCYVRVTLRSDAKLYKTGLPEFVWIFRGAKLYDPRKDSTVSGGSGSHRYNDEATHEWSDNAALALYHYGRGFRVNGDLLAGVAAPETSLPAGDWMDEADYCDELVGLKPGGTEKRYRASGIIDVGTEPRSVIREMLAACAGDLIDSGGIFKLRVGVARAPVLTITDDDIETTGDVEIVPKVSRSQLVNTVYGSFTDPSQNYESTSLPPRVSLDDQAADGGVELAEHYNLPFVSSGTQGQRVTEILRRKARAQKRISLPLRCAFAGLEAGDWVTVNSDRYGISGGLFEAQQAQLARHLSVACDLSESGNSVFAWTAADDELDPADPKPVAAGGSTFTTVAGFTLDTADLPSDTDGVTIPALAATWTPIDDPTVAELVIEYRTVGETVALERRVLDPTAGSFVWAEGIQGETTYEARVRPVTRPERAVSWTGWVATDQTPAVIVPITAESFDALPDEVVKLRHVDQETFTTFLIYGPDGDYFLNMATGQFGASDSTFTLDARNKIITAQSVLSADFRYIYNTMNLIPLGAV